MAAPTSRAAWLDVALAGTDFAHVEAGFDRVEAGPRRTYGCIRVHPGDLEGHTS
jgi:hypothetical protein